MTNTYTDLQKSQLRLVMGYSKLFSSSNSVFENVLNTIQQTSYDDGSTFNNTITLLNNILAIDMQRANNSNLGLATSVGGKIQYDAYRNDAMLKSIGRNYIKQLSIIFSMEPAKDYYGRATVDLSGDTNVPGQSHDM